MFFTCPALSQAESLGVVSVALTQGVSSWVSGDGVRGSVLGLRDEHHLEMIWKVFSFKFLKLSSSMCSRDLFPKIFRKDLLSTTIVRHTPQDEMSCLSEGNRTWDFQLGRPLL